MHLIQIPQTQTSYIKYIKRFETIKNIAVRALNSIKCLIVESLWDIRLSV